MNILPNWRTAIVIMGLGCGMSAVSASGAVHTVRSGDTLTKISRQYKVPLSSLIAANRGIKADTLAQGQLVNIPRTGTKAGKEPTLVTTPPTRAGSRKPAPSDEAVDVSRPVPQTRSSATMHKVKAGETLMAISRRYGVSVASLRSWNQLSGDSIHSGQNLVVSGGTAVERNKESSRTSEPRRTESNAPAGGGRMAHLVRKNETFSTIARKHGVSWGKLYRANTGVDPEAIRPGQRLWIPTDEMADTTVNTTPPPPRNRTPEPEREEKAAADDHQHSADPESIRTNAQSGAYSRLGYRVLPGETVDRIARKFHVEETNIREINGLAKRDLVREGDMIYVPFFHGTRNDQTVAADEPVRTTY